MHNARKINRWKATVASRPYIMIIHTNAVYKTWQQLHPTELPYGGAEAYKRAFERLVVHAE